MTFRQYRYLVRADLYRYAGRADWRAFCDRYRVGEGFRFTFWLRTCRYARSHPVLRFLLYPLAKFMWKHDMYKFGLASPYLVDIGPGFFIGHYGGIVVSPAAAIGRDVNLSHGVTLGKANRGRHQGYPTIGDRVYLGPGAKIVGAVRVGADAAVGANCVVTEDVPDHAVVVGIPGRVVSEGGSTGYVENTDYERILGPWPA